MKVGFTGTRHGMTDEQKREFRMQFSLTTTKEFHHGDCVGADAEAHDIVRLFESGIVVHVRPGPYTFARAFKKGDVKYEPKFYFARNRDIVDTADFMFAAPNSFEEQATGGTWYTIRYARKTKISLCIIWPDGSTTYEKGTYEEFRPIGHT